MDRTIRLHWTHEIALKNFQELNSRYTIFRRNGKQWKSFNNIKDYVTNLELLYNTKFEKPRIALHPRDDNNYLVMEYPEDGTFWVKGFLIDGSLIKNVS